MQLPKLVLAGSVAMALVLAVFVASRTAHAEETCSDWSDLMATIVAEVPAGPAQTQLRNSVSFIQAMETGGSIPELWDAQNAFVALVTNLWAAHDIDDADVAAIEACFNGAAQASRNIIVAAWEPDQACQGGACDDFDNWYCSQTIKDDIITCVSTEGQPPPQ